MTVPLTGATFFFQVLQSKVRHRSEGNCGVARLRIKLRAVSPHSMFSKGPFQSVYFFQNDFDRLEKWFGRN